MLIPRFVQQALLEKPIPVYGDGSQRRSFTWVGDTVNALVGLSEHPEAVGEVFNIGHSKDISILGLAQLVKEVTGSKSKIDLSRMRRPSRKALKSCNEDFHTFRKSAS